MRGTVADIRTTESLRTLVKIDPATALVGWQLPGALVLTEDGGRYGSKLRWVAGAPEYRIGEEVIVFVAQRADGTLHTADLGMGKYEIEAGRALRRLGGGANVLRAGRLLPPRDDAVDVKRFADSIRARRGQLHAANRAFRVPNDARAEPAEAFTYLGTPARWFDPVAAYAIDRNGLSGFTSASSHYAAQQAAAAWSSGASLTLVIGDAIDPAPFAGCDGSSSITFDDPADELDDLANCAGTLAVSGFCSSSETTVIGPQVYRRIAIGKVLVNDGVGECLRGDPCKLAELLTHELGHTIGLGHSADASATMSAVAHFDRRCALLRQDDLATEAIAYPAPGARTAMVTATATPN
ncbi:MAG TPA: matrixin family metalloprotease, partial [Dongiaceae bacterium]|nr:matrixin family metalloprotease [Dongiaceae bacterium]